MSDWLSALCYIIVVSWILFNRHLLWFSHLVLRVGWRVRAAVECNRNVKLSWRLGLCVCVHQKLWSRPLCLDNYLKLGSVHKQRKPRPDPSSRPSSYSCVAIWRMSTFHGQIGRVFAVDDVDSMATVRLAASFRWANLRNTKECWIWYYVAYWVSVGEFKQPDVQLSRTLFLRKRLQSPHHPSNARTTTSLN